MKNKIILVGEREKVEQTIKFLKQAQVYYGSILNTAISPNYIINQSLEMAELSLKSLFIFYLGKYEKTHFFNSSSLNMALINELEKKGNSASNISSLISKYQEIAKKLSYPDTRYNQTNSGYKEMSEVFKTCEGILLIAWDKLGCLLDKNK